MMDPMTAVVDHGHHHKHHHNNLTAAEEKLPASNSHLISRTSNLLQNKSFTDVTFIVGPASHSKKYVGHRVLLAMTSPVFEAMFYGDLSAGDKGNKVIRIPDLAPIGFENLLRYAYTDSLNLNSVEDAMLTAYAAKKYLLPHLLKECTAFVEKHVSATSACSVLEFASLLHSSNLLFQALQSLDRNTYQVLGHKSLNGVQSSTLALLSSRRYLNIYSEASLISACISWAGSEARRRGLDSSDFSVLRFLLEEAGVFRHLRFLALTPEELSRVITSSTGISKDVVTSQLTIRSSEDGGLITGQGGTSNQLLSLTEQVSLFMNMAIPGIRVLPKGISNDSRPRAPPPDYFVVRRTGLKANGVAAPVNSVSPAAKAARSVAVKFQVPSFDIFVVGASLGIRLDPGFYSIRSPKLDLNLRFTSKPGIAVENTMNSSSNLAADAVFDDDSLLSAALTKDKDAVVRFKRPLMAKKGTLNEITLTFGVNDDLVVLKSGSSTKARNVASNASSEVVDAEGIDWLFFKASSSVGLEFPELFYYY